MRENKTVFHNRAYCFFPFPSYNIIFSKLISQREYISFTKITLSRVAAQQCSIQPTTLLPAHTCYLWLERDYLEGHRRNDRSWAASTCERSIWDTREFLRGRNCRRKPPRAFIETAALTHVCNTYIAITWHTQGRTASRDVTRLSLRLRL